MQALKLTYSPRRLLTMIAVAGLVAIVIATLGTTANAKHGRHSPRVMHFMSTVHYASMLPHAKARTAGTFGASQLQAIAMAVASGAGDPNPSNMEAVKTTYGQALAMVYGTVPPETANTAAPVYVISMTGHFTAYHALIPPGAALPTGTQQTLIVDLNGNTLDGWLNSNPQPALARAGQVMQISNTSARQASTR